MKTWVSFIKYVLVPVQLLPVFNKLRTNRTLDEDISTQPCIISNLVWTLLSLSELWHNFVGGRVLPRIDNIPSPAALSIHGVIVA